MYEHTIDWKNERYKDHLIYLFFDLLQMSRDILQITSATDHIILVGDTPSYLEMFLRDHRKITNLPSSNKPFGCFWAPYGTPDPHATCDSKRVWTPTRSRMDAFFVYLDTHLKLPSKYLQDHWADMVLIDTSTGQSIHGVSIMLNHYVGNISTRDDECGVVDCADITGAKPLRFINLFQNMPLYNLDPTIATKYVKHCNFLPSLIIPIQTVAFLYKTSFVIFEWFPRRVPFYSIARNGEDLHDTHDTHDRIKYKRLRKKYRYLLGCYVSRDNLTHAQQTKGMRIIRQMTRRLDLGTYITDDLIQTMDNLNMVVLRYKQSHMFRFEDAK
jgi:hypothetical protein